MHGFGSQQEFRVLGDVTESDHAFLRSAVGFPASALLTDFCCVP